MGNSTLANEPSRSLSDATTELLHGTAVGAQLRYRFKGADWWDTLLRTENGFAWYESSTNQSLELDVGGGRPPTDDLRQCTSSMVTAPRAPPFPCHPQPESAIPTGCLCSGSISVGARHVNKEALATQ